MKRNLIRSGGDNPEHDSAAGEQIHVRYYYFTIHMCGGELHGAVGCWVCLFMD